MTDTLNHLPTVVIEQELLRRQNEEKGKPHAVCGSGPQRTYNTSLHVFALFVILFLSTLGYLFPLVNGTEALLTLLQHVPFPSSSADILNSLSRIGFSSSVDISALECFLRPLSSISSQPHLSLLQILVYPLFGMRATPPWPAL